MKRPLAFILALFSGSIVYAQSGSGEIWGHVAAVTGAAVADAEVTLTRVDTGTERETHTDAEGRFGFAAVAPGHYRVTAVHDGYAGRRQEDIVIVPGQRMQLEMPLREAPLPETIALNPYPPIAESARTHLSAPVGEAELHDLPVQDRQYMRLAGLAPHVSEEAAAGGVSVMNFSGVQNRLLVDGFDQTSSITGEPFGREGTSRLTYQVSQASIDSMRVHVAGAPAEHGRAAAGIFDVVTRSGANAFHGSAYEFFGDRALNAKTTLQASAGLPKPAYRSNQFGGLLGGAITKEHNFFLVSYDGIARRAASPAATAFALVGPLSDFAASRASALAPRDERQNLFLARTDHTYGGQHLMLRFNEQRFDGTTLDVQTLEPAFTSVTPAMLRNRSGAASALAVFGSAVTNEFRAQYADNRDEEMRPRAYNSAGPGAGLAQSFWYQDTFVGMVGGSRYGTHEFATRRVQAADSIGWVAGGHSIKVGADYLSDHNTIGFGFQGAGFYHVGVVPSSAGFRMAGPIRPTRIDSTQYAGFAQDAWRATRALTIDLGLRYDRQDMRPLPDDGGHLAPRVGFAYSPGGRGKTVRGSYGIFYGSTPAVVPVLMGGFGRASQADASFQQPRVQQASIGAEFEKYRAGSASVQYVFARGEHLPRAVNEDIHYRYPWPVVSFQSDAESVYNGISFNLRTRVLNQLFYRVAYTAGRSDETPQQPLGFVFGGLNERLVLATSDLLNRRAPGNNDAHQRLEVAATWDTRLAAANRSGLSKRLLDDWMFALVYTWQTGFPYSAFIFGDLNQDVNAFNDVAPGTTWNQFRLPYRGSFDPRATRRFDIGGTRQLELIWEAFNITNRPNYTAVDTTMFLTRCTGGTPCTLTLVPGPDFGRKTAQSNGRMMQLAARFTF